MGDLHRIPRNSDRTYSDPCFAQRLPKKRSAFHTRPAYAHTKAEVGEVK